jgi:hypothetical protein
MGWRSAPCTIACSITGAITVRQDLRVRVARSLAGSSARDLFKELDGQPAPLELTNTFPACIDCALALATGSGTKTFADLTSIQDNRRHGNDYLAV